jgi:hypothetical protein
VLVRTSRPGGEYEQLAVVAADPASGRTGEPDPDGPNESERREAINRSETMY